MTRPPNPETRTLQLNFKPKPGWEPSFKAFKEVCARDSLEMSEEFFHFLTDWLKHHNWPPGNPQRSITEYQDKSTPVDEAREYDADETDEEGWQRDVPRDVKYKRKLDTRTGGWIKCDRCDGTGKDWLGVQCSFCQGRGRIFLVPAPRTPY